MVSIVNPKSPPSQPGDPAWDIARLFPLQGYWQESDYLALDINYLVEFTDGSIEVLTMPTPGHQRIVLYLLDELRAFTRPAKLGEVLVAPMRVRLRSGSFREPDVIFMLAEHVARKGAGYWDGADLVMEVVSDDAESHERDYARKRSDYAQAGIAKYWIVDPQEKKITVLTLHRGEYVVHCAGTPGQQAASALLAGFSVAVSDVLDSAMEG